MWFREYRDYKIDQPLLQAQVEPSHGIIGCEMHDLNGWGTTLHHPLPKQSKGIKPHQDGATLVQQNGRKDRRQAKEGGDRSN